MANIRVRRHWRRLYYPGCPFVWRQRIVFEDVQYEPGDPLPAHLVNKGWLRRKWKVRIIEFQARYPYAADDPRNPAYVAPAEDQEPAGGDFTTDLPPAPDGGEAVPVLDEEQIGAETDEPRQPALPAGIEVVVPEPAGAGEAEDQEPAEDA